MTQVLCVFLCVILCMQPVLCQLDPLLDTINWGENPEEFHTEPSERNIYEGNLKNANIQSSYNPNHREVIEAATPVSLTFEAEPRIEGGFKNNFDEQENSETFQKKGMIEIPPERNIDEGKEKNENIQSPSIPEHGDHTASVNSTSEEFQSSLLDPPTCGSVKVTFRRVIGGENAGLGMFPWMALLGYRTRFGDIVGATWRCGGTLVSSRHVLTAAHCIHKHEDDLYVVRLGELNLDSEDEGATPVDILIKEKIKHENYVPKPTTNDIGILVLAKDSTFTNLIKPICIPKNDELKAKKLVRHYPFVAGWGSTEYKGAGAAHLQMLQVPVVENEYCAQRYHHNVIDDRVMCAGHETPGKDTCTGDSGGPLMMPIRKGKNFYFYQIGITSYGKECARAGYPGVYCSVLHFAPWIAEKVARHL